MNASATELELQHELQRFTTELVDRVTQAASDLERAADADVRDDALRKCLLYASSAIEIATGPDARVGVLDMIALVHLSRGVLERHWVPRVYGELGRPLGAAFAKADEDLAKLAERALGFKACEDARKLADSWLDENPDQVRVEGIRFSDFASNAGDGSSARAGRAGGLLSSVKSASRTASDALLLTERGLFLVHRMPFLWRLQARLGAREILSDSLARLVDDPGSPMHRAEAYARRAALVGLAALIGTVVLVWLLSVL